MSPSQEAVSNCEQTATLYPGHRVLLMFPFFNEASRISLFAQKLRTGIADKIVAVNDGSTDSGPDILRNHGIEVWDQSRSGIGACVKKCVKYAREHGYDILVVMAGNNKDNPLEAPRLVAPIVQKEAHYVQGSRFLPGGSYPNLPLFRYFVIRILSMLFRIYSKKACTDLTNGFRAYRIDIFDDPRINIWQEWLDTYEYEYYVHWKVYTLGYKVEEAPVTKAYPDDKRVKYTKVKPITGWWRAIRPFLILGLHIKE